MKIDPQKLPRISRQLSGIYFLWLNGDLQYIGLSRNLLQRISTHIHWSFHLPGMDLNYKRFDEFSYLEISDNLEKIEAELIERFRPPLNFAGKAGPDMTGGMDQEEPTTRALEDLLAQNRSRI